MRKASDVDAWAQKIIYFLLLSHAAMAIRSASFGNQPSWVSLIILAVIGILFFLFPYCA